MSVEKGIHLPNGDFISKTDIERKKLMKGEATLLTDMPLVKNFEYWGNRFEKRQDQYKESEIRQEK